MRPKRCVCDAQGVSVGGRKKGWVWVAPLPGRPAKQGGWKAADKGLEKQERTGCVWEGQEPAREDG